MKVLDKNFIKEAYKEHKQNLFKKSKEGKAASWLANPPENLDIKLSMEASMELALMGLLRENPESINYTINNAEEANGAIHFKFMVFFRRNKEEMFKSGTDKFEYSTENIKKQIKTWIKEENGKVKIHINKNKYIETKNDLNQLINDGVAYIEGFELVDFLEVLLSRSLTHKVLETNEQNYGVNKKIFKFPKKNTFCEEKEFQLDALPKEFGNLDYLSINPKNTSSKNNKIQFPMKNIKLI